MDNKIYWAADTPEEAVKGCQDAITLYYQFCRSGLPGVNIGAGVSNVWAQVYRLYNSAMYRAPRLITAGQYGEYTIITVNHFRNIVQHSVSMITNQRPAIS